LFMVREPSKLLGLAKTFAEDGLKVEFLDSLETLKQRLQDKKNFLLFVDVHEHQKVLRWLFTQGTHKNRSFLWVAIMNAQSPAHINGLVSMGASDVLSTPVHPHIFRTRARLMLTRFLSYADFPWYVRLPAGVVAP